VELLRHASPAAIYSDLNLQVKENGTMAKQMRTSLKKLLALMLALSMTMGLLNLTAFAAGYDEALTMKVDETLDLMDYADQADTQYVPLESGETMLPFATWASSDTYTATVDDRGLVSAWAAGEVTITRTSYVYQWTGEDDTGNPDLSYYDFDDPEADPSTMAKYKCIDSWQVTIQDLAVELAALFLAPDGVDLTDIQGTLVSKTDGATYQSFTAGSDGVNTWVLFEGMPADNYTCTITARDTSGTLYKGTLSVFSFELQGAVPGERVQSSFMAMLKPVVEENKTQANFRLQVEEDDGSVSDYVCADAVVTLTNQSGVSYSATLEDGSYKMTVPSGLAYTLSISAPKDETHAYVVTKELRADLFPAGAKSYSVTLKSTDLKEIGGTPEPSDQIQVYFQAYDTDATTPLANTTIRVSANFNASAAEHFNVVTDQEGKAVMTLPTADSYDVGLVLNGVWQVQAVQVPAADLSTTAEAPYVLTARTISTPDPLENITVTVNSYVSEGGAERLFRTVATQDYPFYEQTQHNVSGVLYEGLTQCTGAEVLLNGTPCAVEPYDPAQINQWQTADGAPIFRLNLSGNAPSIMLHSANLTDGDSLEIRFHYAYTDQDAQYSLTVQHQFFANRDDLAPVYTETETPRKLHAGDPFTVLAQTSQDNLTIQKDIPGYEKGTWQLGVTKLEGGAEDSFIGRFADRQNDYEASNTMIHADASLVFAYFYIPPTDSGNPGGGGGGGTTKRYDLVVRYLEEGTEKVLATAYSTDKASGSSYDVTDRTEKEIDGYVRTDITGDPVKGTMNSDKEIIVWYVPEEDIEEPETPTTETPENPEEPGTDVPDPDVPTTDLPEEEVPKAEVPATGDASLLWLAAAALSGTGLAWLALSERKGKREE
jgi:hypothetical protein